MPTRLGQHLGAGDGEGERRLFLAEADRLVLALAPFVIDPGVSTRANLCLPLANMGWIDQARAQGTAALARSPNVSSS